MKWLFLGIPILLFFGGPVRAQEDSYYEDSESVLNSDDIDIDGIYERKPKRPSAADRIEKMRRDLEKRNEQMMKKKVEDIRLKEEEKLTKKLKKAFDSGFSAMDKMDGQEGEQGEQEQKDHRPSPPPKKSATKGRVVPKFGVSILDDGGQVDFQSRVSFGLDMEIDVSPRFAAGLGFGYMDLGFVDRQNDPFGFGQSWFNNWNGNYSRFSFGAYSKYFLVPDAKLRPYLGLGLNFNRSNTNDDGDQSYCVGLQVNCAGPIRESYFSTSLLLGADLSLSDGLGVQVDLKYDYSFENANNNQYNNRNNWAPVRIANLSNSLNSASTFTASLGIQVKF